jgi:hypothetical protein
MKVEEAAGDGGPNSRTLVWCLKGDDRFIYSPKNNSSDLIAVSVHRECIPTPGLAEGPDSSDYK